MTTRHNLRGFSLIELMIVVAILGIVATIANSSYRNYLVRTHRTDATAALLQIQVAQEKFFLQNNAYAGTAQIALAPPAGLGLSATTTQGGYYTLTITPAVPTVAYTATATPISTKGQASDADCQSFSVDQSGRKSALDSSSTDNSAKCWR